MPQNHFQATYVIVSLKCDQVKRFLHKYATDSSLIMGFTLGTGLLHRGEAFVNVFNSMWKNLDNLKPCFLRFLFFLLHSNGPDRGVQWGAALPASILLSESCLYHLCSRDPSTEEHIRELRLCDTV